MAHPHGVCTGAGEDYAISLIEKGSPSTQADLKDRMLN